MQGPIRNPGTIGLVVAILVATPASPAHLLATASSPQAHVPLPFEEEGTLGGAPYRVVVPENWNGTLLVWAHGYRDKADHPGEVDNRVAPAAPGGSVEMEQLLLAEGFALAGSAYRDNGFAVEEGVHDTLALTNRFNGIVGKPSMTIVWGASLGSIVTLELIEKHRGIYDGAIGLCTAGAGSPRAWDGFLALALAYDAAFGWPAEWGTPENVRDDLDFETEVLPVLLGQLADPANLGRFEFVRMVNDLPLAGFYGAPGWLFFDFFFGSEGRAEMERRAGDFPVQNLEHVYSLTDAEKAHLAGLGVDADALLAFMDGRRVAARPSARHYLERYAEFEGDIERPVLTMHTTTDGLLPTWHERAYGNSVAANDKTDLLVQVYTDSVGHCTFSAEQTVAVALAMDFWVRTGVVPGPAFFPESLGFVPGFEPEPLPYQVP